MFLGRTYENAQAGGTRRQKTMCPLWVVSSDQRPSFEPLSMRLLLPAGLSLLPQVSDVLLFLVIGVSYL